MGVIIEGFNKGYVKIYGVGINGFMLLFGLFYLGNSGMLMWLLFGLLLV